MKFNILYIHNKSDISGGERSLINLWKNIDRSKFDLFLIIPGKGDLSEKARECGVHIFYSEAPKLCLKNTFNICAVLFEWVRCILGKKINLIHSYAPRNNILSGILGRLLFKPVIWHERNLIYDDKSDVTRRFLFLPTKIICNSAAIAERFRKKTGIPKKVKIIHNGVDLERFSPSINNLSLKEKLTSGKNKVVGIVTNLSKRKRADFFLEAAAKINKEFNDVVFVIVGGNFPREDDRMSVLKKKAKVLGIERQVVFAGFQENTVDYISIFDVSVNVTEKDACSRAIIESMACGKAVVAINDGGTPELISNGIDGWLTDPADVDGVVRAVVTLLRDEEKRKIMGEKARRSAEERFDIKTNVRKVQDLYISMIERK